MPWAAENATTILHATHASQELGNALGDVLFGDYNPGGKLTQTWPRSLDQLPPMMDYDIRHGRTYMYFKGEPQYPFGYGLSYTTFALRRARARRRRRSLGGRGDRERGRDEHRAARRRRGRAALRPLRRLDGRAPGEEAPRLRARHDPGRGDAARGRSRCAGRTSPTGTRPGHAWALERARLELMVGGSSADAALTLRRTIDVGP